MFLTNFQFYLFESNIVYWIVIMGENCGGMLYVSHHSDSPNGTRYDVSAARVYQKPVHDLARYIDWTITTPMHVAVLGLLAGVSTRCILRVAGAQAATNLLGLVGAYLTGALAYLCFALGSVTFLYVLYVLYGEVTDAVQKESGSIVGLHRKLLNFIAVLWLIYPVIWLLAPSVRPHRAQRDGRRLVPRIRRRPRGQRGRWGLILSDRRT